jgi:hypothetical protein
VDGPADLFSAGRALEIVRALGGDGAPRPAGSAANLETVESIASALRALGLEVEVQQAFACGPFGVCAHVRNVLGRLGPPGKKAVALAAHHDSVPAGPGAADDLSGVAIVLETARALAREPAPGRPFVALVTDAEEAGLVGAAAFSSHPWAREVGAIVNLEARGTSGPSIMFETSGAPEWIGRAVGRLPHPVTTSLAPAVYELLPNDTDLTVFARQGLPGANLAFASDVVHYHTPNDDLAHLDPASLQHQGENALALVRALLVEDLEHPRRERMLFFDVLGIGVVSWRGAVGPAVAAALAVFLAAALLVARRRVRPAALAWGLGAALAAPLLGAAPTLLAWLALQNGALASPFVASPAPFLGAAWAAGAFGALLALALFGRRAGAEGLFAGSAALWALLALALAARLPGASYVATVPALAAGAVGLAWALSRGGGVGWPLLAALVPALAAGVVLFPISLLVPEMLGIPSAVAVSALVALVGFTPAPAGAGASGAARLGPPAAALLAAVALAAVQATRPAATPERPARLSLAYHEEAGQARWVAGWRGAELPAALAVAAPFARTKERLFPWASAEPSFAAPAPPVGIPPPEARVLSSAPVDGGRRVSLRLSSRRGAPRVMLFLPPEARLRSAALNGVALPEPRRKWIELLGGARPVGCATTPAEGVEIELHLEGTAPIEATVMDLAYGLPPSGAPLAAARPPEVVLSQDGDVTLASARVRL